jgi:hypothetical protein
MDPSTEAAAATGEAVETNPQKLVCLEITGPTTVWNRILYTDEPPNQEDLEFYYRHLLGIEGARVTVKVDEVPPEFNTGLLGISDSMPVTWPACDLETPVGKPENRAKFQAFIHQLCEMEKARAELKLFQRGNNSNRTTIDLPPADTYTSAVSDEAPVGRLLRTTVKKFPKREWVKELLTTLNEDSYGDDAIAIIACEQETVPYAWIFTPVIASLRRSLGSRIILNAEIGKKWQDLLGTTYYPDLVVSRRITTAAWTFHHETADTLIKSVTDWYLASQAATLVDGVSNMIPDADRDIGNILFSIRRVKVNESILFESAGSNDRVSQVYKLMSAVEHTLLDSADSNPEISPISPDAFHKYMNYLFRGSNIPRDLYTSLDGVSQIMTRWVRNRMGFRKDGEPLLSSWKELWDLTMRGAPTAARVNHFLATLDTYDTMQLAILSSADRVAITHEWVRIFLDTQIVKDTNGGIRSILLYDKIREWCSKYLPMEAFRTMFSPMNVGPVLTRRGLVTYKHRGGRIIRGIAFRDPEMGGPDVGGAVGEDEEVLAAETLDAEDAERVFEEDDEDVASSIPTMKAPAEPAPRKPAPRRSAAATAAAKNTVTLSSTDEAARKRKPKIEKTKTAAATATTVKRDDGSRIETFFAVTTETIHLGTL